MVLACINSVFPRLHVSSFSSGLCDEVRWKRVAVSARGFKVDVKYNQSCKNSNCRGKNSHIHLSVWDVKGKALNLHMCWQVCIALKKGLLQNTVYSLHSKLSGRDKIRRSYFPYEAVQFLTLLIKKQILSRG